MGGQIFDVAVGQGGDVFVPDTVNISVGDTVRWTWAEKAATVSPVVIRARLAGSFVLRITRTATSA